jgi:8-oxo-dGTP pyrophosphatase MutT (NUDIX family)
MVESAQLDKVTAFIVRKLDDKPHLLVFQHGGIQLPAGTAEPGEHPDDAALREATEETGLSGLKLERKLAEASEELGPDERVVLLTTPVYTRPDDSSPTWSQLRNGLRVKQLRSQDDFVLVEYIETNLKATPTFVSYQITGWVPGSTVTNRVTRHFYLFSHTGNTPREWSHIDEQHTFRLFWAPLSDMPKLSPSQQAWLNFLPSNL